MPFFRRGKQDVHLVNGKKGRDNDEESSELGELQVELSQLQKQLALVQARLDKASNEQESQRSNQNRGRRWPRPRPNQ